MKYENFNKVLPLVEAIDKRQKMIEDLQSPTVTVIINYSELSGRIMTIGAHESYEHQYTPLATEFVKKIVDDCKAAIESHKAELEQL